MKRNLLMPFAAFVFIFSSFFSIGGTVNHRPKSKNVIISGNIDFLSDSTTISITLASPIFGFGVFGNEDITKIENFRRTSVSVKVINHKFSYKIENVEQPLKIYIGRIAKPGQAKFDLYLSVSPGDSVIVINKNNDLFFLGKRGAKFNCEYQLYQISRSPVTYTWMAHGNARPDLTLWYFQQIDSLESLSLKKLEKFKRNILPDDYWLFKADIFIRFQYNKFDWVSSFGTESDKSRRVDYLKDYKSLTWNKKQDTELDQVNSIQHISLYFEFRINQFKMDSCFMKHKPFNVKEAYRYFTKHYIGSVREWFIYKLMYGNRLGGQDIIYCINDAFNHKYISNTSIKQYLTDLRVFTPGTLAFNFALSDTSGKVVRLSDLKGKFVLIDTWHIPCPVCRQLHPILDSIKSLINNNDLVVVSICRDVTNHGKKKWLETISTGAYTTADNLNLYESDPITGRADNAPFSRHYGFNGDPNLLLVDKNGKLTERPTYPLMDKGRSLVWLIKHNL